MKKRTLLYPFIVLILFPVLTSLGLSVAGCLIAGILIALPVYFFCFVMKLPVWIISKHKKPTPEMNTVKVEALETAEKIAEEGIVLLKNEEQLLPLKEEEISRINVFGRCSIQTFYNGSGSAASDLSKCIPIIHALEQFGHFELNEDLLNLHLNYIRDRKISIDGSKNQNVGVVKINKGGAEFLGKRPDLILDEIPAEIFESTRLYGDERNIMEHAKDFSEYAMVVVGRGGSEGFELQAGDLKLSDGERRLLDIVSKYFDKVILVLNTSNPLELGCLSDYPSVKAVLWMGMPGSMGTVALSNVLRGKVNPSGRLADIWLKDNFAAPAANNFQLRNKDGSWNEKSYHLDNYKENSGYFLHYYEGIYVGYKYFETRHQTDALYDYDKEVMYPFGYGLSYTEFKQKITGFKVLENEILLKVEVKNTGVYEGKEVILVCFVPPYTGRIEKSAVNLVDFAKTEVLQPGQKTSCTFRIPLDDLASFDMAEEKAYVLEKGEYEICIMKNSHEKWEAKKWSLEKEIVFREDKDGKRDSDFTAAVEQFADAKTMGKDLTRKWEPDSNAFIGPDGGCYHASDEVLAVLERGVTTDEEAGFTWEDMPKTRVKLPRRLMFEDMKGVPFEDNKWNEFISQMSIGEMANLCGNGAWHIEKIRRLGIPKRLMPDGSTVVCSTLFSGIVMGNAGEGITYPNPVVTASTWNKEMALRMGRAVGREARALGYHGWYAPTMNCHRTPFNARNFEYYSEDGVLAGRIAAEVVKGVQEEGILAFIKHFAMNERESSGRNQLLTYCNEQAIREIYLKPFEIAVKEGNAAAVMTSFNYIGNIWAGAHEALLENVLRKEWGFQGLVSTDACVYPHMDVKKMIISGGDLSLDSLGGFAGGNIKRVELLKAAKASQTRVIVTKGLQRASKNILYAFSRMKV